MNLRISNRQLQIGEILIIVLTAFIPLLFSYPYRINLFLAWEGSFRMMEGQIPYKDFGTPVGYFFWVIPALFFKIFGPYVYTLIKAQVFINLISNFAFRELLKSLGVQAEIRVFAILIYCLSFSLFNFWPWYNHLVFVLELIGLVLLVKSLFHAGNIKYLLLILSAVVIALAFMTKQDTGGLSFVIAISLLGYHSILRRDYKKIIVFGGSYALAMAAIILPFTQYEFSYWFNYGQYPHYSRVDSFDFVSEILGASDWIKFYVFFILFLMITKYESLKSFLLMEKEMLFFLVTLAILVQASIIQITSYTPIDGNIYFHSFAIAFILYNVEWKEKLNARLVPFLMLLLLAGLWWSGVYWNRFLKNKVATVLNSSKPEVDNLVSKQTYISSLDTLGGMERSHWVLSDITSFEKIKLPEATIEGIHKIMELPIVKEKGRKVKMLNLSELTPLAYEMGYELEKGPDFPLWYHKGVAFFNREVEMFCQKISNKEYDVILFEDIPDLNQFYPYEVRDCAKENGYHLAFKFLAPRIPEFSYVEVYVKLE